MSHLIWIHAVCKSLLLSLVAVKELNRLSFSADTNGDVTNNMQYFKKSSFTRMKFGPLYIFGATLANSTDQAQ